MDPATIAKCNRLKKKIEDHFSEIDHMIGGFIYRCVYFSDDPSFDSRISHRCPENTQLHEKVWPLLWGDDGIKATAEALELFEKSLGTDLLDAPLSVFRAVVRLRSRDIFKAML